jgi:hypothetical protein
MASRAHIERLSQRIDALAVPQAADRYAVIYVSVGESEEAAKARHYLARPEDREASRTMIVQYVDPKAGRPAEEVP